MPELDLRDFPKTINPAYLPLIGNRSRYLVMRGGAGSGKSVFARQKILTRGMVEPGHNLLIIRKVAATHRLSTWANIVGSIYENNWSKLFNINKSDKEIIFRPNGSRWNFIGLDNREKIKSIDRPSSSWIEEATELTLEDFEQLDLRFRGDNCSYYQHILTFNPISATHWIKKRFYDSGEPNATTVLTTYRDNVFLDEQYRNSLERLKERDLQLWRIYAEGLWGVIKGLIYPEIPTRALPTDWDERFYGLDFGFNNPTALAEIRGKDRVYTAREVVYERELTTEELMQTMERRRVAKSSVIWADSAEPDRIKQMKSNGWNVKAAKKSQGSVKAGIDFVKSLDWGITGASMNARKELDGYKWDSNSDGDSLEKPVEFMDHFCDAIRYAFHNQLRSQQSSTIRTAKPGLVAWG